MRAVTRPGKRLHDPGRRAARRSRPPGGSGRRGATCAGARISSFALIDTHGRLHGFAPHRRYVTASVVKAMLLVARLRQLGNHLPSASDRAVLEPMIEVSDNDAADAAYGWVGDAALLAVGKRAGMHDLRRRRATGATSTSAPPTRRASSWCIDRLVPPRSRAYARHLLSSIVSYQRWGFSRFSLRRGWHTFFKGGWRTTGAAARARGGAVRARRPALLDGGADRRQPLARLRHRDAARRGAQRIFR